MRIPDGIPYDNRDDYRDGYRDGYRGYEGIHPTEPRTIDLVIRNKLPERLPMDHPKCKAYWKGWEDGRRKYTKLKGGIGAS